MDDKQGQNMEIRNLFIQDRLGWVKLGCLARKTELFSRFDPKKFEFSRLNYWLVVA